MGFYKIPNLYKSQDILQFKQCYALEKIHGTSCNIKYLREDNTSTLTFFAGGCNHEHFVSIFNKQALLEKFYTFGTNKMTVFGEGYGGKMQGMKEVYGKDLKFVVFDVRVGDSWLSVEKAQEVALKLGLEFVDYKLVPTDLDVLDHERNKPSVQAMRNGCGDDKPREGVVLRPPFEVMLNNGKRLIAKYKAESFSETRKTRKIVDPANLEVIKEAQALCDEWCTAMRLDHILGSLPPDTGMEKMGDIIKLMISDIEVEGEGEIEMSRQAKKLIGGQTVKMFKAKLQSKLEKVS